MDSQKVIQKAMCIFEHNGRVLVSKGFDKVKQENFYRFLGGHIEAGEGPEEAIRREIMEEIDSEIENLVLIEARENFFTYQGEECHEFIHLFSGDLTRRELYEREVVPVKEPAHEFEAYWIPLKEILDKKIPLYPKYDYAKLFSAPE